MIVIKPVVVSMAASKSTLNVGRSVEAVLPFGGDSLKAVALKIAQSISVRVKSMGFGSGLAPLVVSTT